MCRLLAYLGTPIAAEDLIVKPEHSLVVQSYQPRELEVALLNADGFGIGWYGSIDTDPKPHIYRNVLPIWNDGNLADLCRYVRTGSLLANIRSATPGLPLDFSNCQPFRHGSLLFVHNGYIDRFRETLYRPIRDLIGDRAYQNIYGLTDSEHIFALVTHTLEEKPSLSLRQALEQALATVIRLADRHGVRASGVIIIGDGTQLLAARFDNQAKAPSFYYLCQPQGIILASEPLFPDSWQPMPQGSSLTVTAADLQPTLHDFSYLP